MKVKFKFFGLLAVAFALLLGSQTVLPAHANDEEKAAYSQLINPAKNYLELNPGDVRTDSFDIYNTGLNPFSIHVYAMSFQTQGDDYQFLDYNSENIYSQIRNWITFEQEYYDIAPGDFVRVNYTVTVPDDVPAGGQYSAIMSELIRDDDSAINTINRVSMILYATVNGETHLDGYGKILENSINTFFTEPPIFVSSLVKNEGNVHATATYILNIYPLFSNDPAYTNENSPFESTVLPETSRLNTITWKGAPALGIFRAVSTISFMGETSTTEKIIFICPIWLICVAILAIIGLIARAIARKRSNKKA